MSNELSAKIQTALWWITSIAVSVVCCSILFVLFASYLVEVKASVKDSAERISIIEEREGRILSEIEMIRKRVVVQPASAPAVEAPASVPVNGAAPASVETPSAAPAASAPAAPAALVPADKK